MMCTTGSVQHLCPSRDMLHTHLMTSTAAAESCSTYADSNRRPAAAAATARVAAAAAG